MNSADHPNNTLPPLPQRGERGPHVCEVVQLYLPIIDDLSEEQAQVLLEHVRICAACAGAYQMFQQVTHALASLPETAPSELVDQAVLQAIAERTDVSRRQTQAGRHISPPRLPLRERINRRVIGTTFGVALAAMVILALVGTFFYAGNIAHAPQTTFALPTNLTWNGYVLYHSQTLLDNQGQRYQVITYYNITTGEKHVETKMDASMDVVAIGTTRATLGLDMMRHVAQWNATAWSSDESMFNLSALRHDLQTGQDSYAGTEMFQGQKVYRILCPNGLTLLLDMDYMPVNVLRGEVGPGTGQPVYDTFRVLPTSQVSDSIWNTSIPSDFTMGTLPAKP